MGARYQSLTGSCCLLHHVLDERTHDRGGALRTQRQRPPPPSSERCSSPLRTMSVLAADPTREHLGLIERRRLDAAVPVRREHRSGGIGHPIAQTRLGRKDVAGPARWHCRLAAARLCSHRRKAELVETAVEQPAEPQQNRNITSTRMMLAPALPPLLSVRNTRTPRTRAPTAPPRS